MDNISMCTRILPDRYSETRKLLKEQLKFEVKVLVFITNKFGYNNPRRIKQRGRVGMLNQLLERTDHRYAYDK